jgi:hypothetical protein
MINLLPKDGLADKGTAKTFQLFKKISIFLVLFYLATGAAAGGYVFYLANKQSDLLAREQELRTNVNNLSASSSGLLLVKDRIGEIQKILNERTNEKNYQTQLSMVDQFPEGMGLLGVNIDQDRSEITVTTTSSAVLREFMSRISSISELSSLTLKSVSFDQVEGYRVSFDLL